MKENLFISESFIGIHSKINFFNANLLSFTYFPIFNKKEIPTVKTTTLPKNFRGIWIDSVNIKKKDEDFNLIDYIKRLKKKNIFIGFDFDKAGDLMASILYYQLIRNGFNPDTIFRIPLFDNGYTAFTDFLSVEATNKLLLEKYYDFHFMTYFSVGRDRLSFNNALYIEKIYNAKKNKEDIKNIAPEENSTITYLVKKELKEE